MNQYSIGGGEHHQRSDSGRRKTVACPAALRGYVLSHCLRRGSRSPDLHRRIAALSPPREDGAARRRRFGHSPQSDGGSGEGAAANYSTELVDALLWDAKRQGADLLLLTGDLVRNSDGKAYRHEALIEKLRKAEETGLSVCVLPGNHDLAPIGQTEFAALYSAFGYDDAYSRDPASLSYCIERGGLLLLMMDCGGYSTDSVDLPGASARADKVAAFSGETLAWAEGNASNRPETRGCASSPPSTTIS